MVALKQPEVPFRSSGCGARLELAPFVWQMAQMASLVVSVDVCPVLPAAVVPRHGLEGWGALFRSPWQPSTFMHEVKARPPLNSGSVVLPEPWQFRQYVKPALFDALLPLALA